MVDLNVPTEIQTMGPQGWDQTNEEAIHIRERDQSETDGPWHSAAIEQRVTNGHVSVKGHYSQDEDFHMDKGDEEEARHYTTRVGNGFGLRYQIFQHFRSDIRREPHICKRQVAEEEIHGAIELGADSD